MEREVLLEILQAWDKLPEGNYRPEVVERWLEKDMAPAMRRVREVLNVSR